MKVHNNYGNKTNKVGLIKKEARRNPASSSQNIPTNLSAALSDKENLENNKKNEPLTLNQL